jgi:methyl-accepting chemotaxis protein
MTIEERFERIEHVTAGLAEERRKDREENRQLWRDTQRQLNELTLKIANTNDTVSRLAEETRAADQQLRERIDRVAEESRAADQRLADRIEALVSAIGKFMAK